MTVHNPVPIATIVQLLGTLNDGRLHQGMSRELQDTLTELASRQARYGGKHKAKLTLTIDIEVDADITTIKADYGAKLAKIAPAKNIFWQTSDGRLTTSNPQQLSLLEDVQRAQQDTGTRAVAVATGQAVRVPGANPTVAIPGGSD